jgi:hypothetical protein
MEADMSAFEDAVAQLEKLSVDRQKNRAAAIELIDNLITTFRDSIAIWQGYLNSPGGQGDQWAQVSWIGPDRAKQLHELSLDARYTIHRFCQLTNGQSSHYDLLEENPVIQAYRMLTPGETGLDAARSAITTMDQRVALMQGYSKRLRTAKPAKGSGSKKAGKKAGRRATKKAAKKSAKKKSAKKASKKKTVKKTKKSKSKKGKKKK